jgi:hypothetical protein
VTYLLMTVAFAAWTWFCFGPLASSDAKYPANGAPYRKELDFTDPLILEAAQELDREFPGYRISPVVTSCRNRHLPAMSYVPKIVPDSWVYLPQKDQYMTPEGKLIDREWLELRAGKPV